MTEIAGGGDDSQLASLGLEHRQRQNVQRNRSVRPFRIQTLANKIADRYLSDTAILFYFILFGLTFTFQLLDKL